MLRTKQKNNKKSLPEPVGQSFPQIWHLNPVLKLVGLGYRKVWDTLWCLLASFATLVGSSWLFLGSSEPGLGPYLGALGHLLAAKRYPILDFGSVSAQTLPYLGLTWALFHLEGTFL